MSRLPESVASAGSVPVHPGRVGYAYPRGSDSNGARGRLVVAMVYLSNAGLDQVAAAQADFDAHVVSSGVGRCVTCAGARAQGRRTLCGF